MGRYRRPGIRVFAGRKAGETVRKAASLDSLDADPDGIEVRIPINIFSLTSSFFLGMFGNSIRTLGEEGFREKYQFLGSLDLSDTIDDCIREALLEWE